MIDTLICLNGEQARLVMKLCRSLGLIEVEFATENGKLVALPNLKFDE